MIKSNKKCGQTKIKKKKYMINVDNFRKQKRMFFYINKENIVKQDYKLKYSFIKKSKI